MNETNIPRFLYKLRISNNITLYTCQIYKTQRFGKIIHLMWFGFIEKLSIFIKNLWNWKKIWNTHVCANKDWQYLATYDITLLSRLISTHTILSAVI